MATRTLLTEKTLAEAKNVLLPPVVPPSGELIEGQAFPAEDFSSWLALKVEGRFRQYPQWVESHPIAIGSWGLGELAPKSDLDIIFCGKEKVVSELVEQLEKDGWPLRYRYPRNKDDWNEDANIFERNALFWARPFSQESSELLQEQKKKILRTKKTFRRKLLREFQKERKKRNQRLDSITNYLEPNLKYGPGGLRDMQQAFMIWFWYGEKLGHHSEVLATLNHLKGFILTVRHRLHLTGYGDVLVAQAQFELAQWFGFKDQKEFMRELQIVLARVSFYCDWIFELAAHPRESQPKDLESAEDVFQILKRSPTLLNQAHALRNIQDIEGFAYNKNFLKVFNIRASDQTLRALYRAQIFPQVIPDFAKIIGVVQHDQYHRYTVGAHLLQAMRRVRKVYESPKVLGRLKAFVINFKKQDWEILLWTALYHDLGKAREKDHSAEGKELALKDLKRFGWSKKFVEEVSWMVENHLSLSTAAFRKDPHSPKLWTELFERGITGIRLRRLAVFTAIDIFATNPEAWSPWKEKLLFDLVKSIETPHVNQFLKFKKEAKKLKLPIPQHLVESLDTGLLTSLPPQALLTDFYSVIQKKAEEIHVYKHPQHGLWVRFYNPVDQDGLFLKYVSRLWSSGVQIRHAYIHTLPDVGVYDWFQIKSNRTTTQINKFLKNIHDVEMPHGERSNLLEVKMVSGSEKEWVFSFQGTNKKGVLIAAAKILYDLGLPIRWAKVHTWGRQVHDTFGVMAPLGQEIEAWTRKIQDRLI